MAVDRRPPLCLPRRLDHRSPRPAGAGDGRDDVAPGMGAELKMKVLYGSLLEETMSRRQLHEAERRAGRDQRWSSQRWIRDAQAVWTLCRSVSVRSCGMEALDAAQHRAKAKLRKANEVWVSVPSNVTPDIQSRPRSSGDGGGVKLCVLTQGVLHGSAAAVGGKEATTTHRCLSVERSDHFVVAMKPGNAGGAKGVTG